MKTFVIGDIHGAYKALVQVLERSGFDYENDLLITLGDICDGWSETYECVEEILKIKNRIDIKGNHDDWFNEFLITGIHPVSWDSGGLETLKSYGKNTLKDSFKIHIHSTVDGFGQPQDYYISNLNFGDIPESHVNFFKGQHRYYIDDKNNLFVHGGFNRHSKLSEQVKSDIYWWDRDLWLGALSANSTKLPYKIKDEFNKIFIGHTSTVNWGKDIPIHAKNIINMDTGAGFNGRLSMMNIDNQEVYQSDLVQELYSNEKGRN